MHFIRVIGLLLLGLLTSLGPSAAAATSLRIVSKTSLPDGVTGRDVRWAGPEEVFVSLGKSGVMKTRVDSARSMTSVMPAGDRGGFPVSGLIGAGAAHLLVASRMGAIGWIPLAGTSRSVGQRGFLSIMDIDARGDLAAVLGADSGPVQGLARDGTIAWTGSLSKGLSDMRPLMKGRPKPGGKDIARCSILETGAIRFMRDGSIVVAPGSEPGVYRYGTDGKLMQTWETGSLGVIDDCSIGEEELLLLARDFPSRMSWYASRVILDEILPLPAGPALLLRRVEKGVTKWDVVVLPYRGGKPERIALPASFGTPRGHVRGDVRGDRVVLLVFEDPLPGEKAVVPPQLIVLSIK